MSSRGFNSCTLAGNVAADPEIRQVDLKAGGSTRVAGITIYVDRIPQRKENDSFIVDISVWEGSAAWRKLAYIKKGSLIIASGAIDASPYISKADDTARAGLQLKATDIFLDATPRDQIEEEVVQEPLVEPAPKATTKRSRAKKQPAAALATV